MEFEEVDQWPKMAKVSKAVWGIQVFQVPRVLLAAQSIKFNYQIPLGFCENLPLKINFKNFVIMS